MRIGIFSDVHSNLEALESTLKFFSKQKIDQYFFIGDLVGYGANPNECVELVENLKGVMVAGNHDYGALDKTDIEIFNDAAKAAILWTKNKLGKASIEFLKVLPLQNSFQNFTLVHSTPRNPDAWDYIFTLKQAQSEFEYFKEQVCFVGHSHCPCIVENDTAKKDFTVVNKNKFKFKDSKFRYLINVGSVGQPRDGDTRACVTLFDTKTRYFELHRIGYNIERAQKKIIEAGLPATLAYRLVQGK